METKEIIKKEYNIDSILLYDKKTHAIKLNKRKSIIAGLLIFTILLSVFVAPFVIDKLQIINEAEKTLESKKDTVVAVTATAAIASVVVASIPGDSTTPLANQIAELDIFFIIVLAAIYLLKILLVISTSLSFKILFPVACVLFIAYFLSNKICFKNLGFKILIFGLVIFLTVPISVKTMNIVDTTLKTQEKTEKIIIEDKTDDVVGEKNKEDKNWLTNFWDDFTDKIKDIADKTVNATKEMYQEAKGKFSELVDIVASLIITCCAIPLLVIVFLCWSLKMLFGINISTKNAYNNLHNIMSNAFIKRGRDVVDEENSEIY